MKKFFRILLFCGGIYMITVACFSNPDDPFAPDPSTTTIETVYIGCAGIGGTAILPNLNWTWFPPALLNADIHVNSYFDKFDKLVEEPYFGFNNMYIEGGVSAFNCADHDHQDQISQNNDGVWSLFFEHNTYWEGTAWLQFVSQCEEAIDDNGNVLGVQVGVYYKGEKYYGAGDYPTSHNEDIQFNQVTLTDCSPPVFPAEEYGCGEDDAN